MKDELGAIGHSNDLLELRRALAELPNKGSRGWEQLQSLKKELNNIGGRRGNFSVKGTNKGLAEVNSAEADYLGKAFVGDGFKTSSDGLLISKDGTRLYRPPTAKPNSPFSQTGIQANFQTRQFNETTGKWEHINNGHIDIRD